VLASRPGNEREHHANRHDAPCPHCGPANGLR
jgi:hypothetical protein